MLESHDIKSTDADIVVPGFNVKNDYKPKQQQNSDMGSDCAYFSGNDDNEDQGVNEDDETFNFNIEDGGKKH